MSYSFTRAIPLAAGQLVTGQTMFAGISVRETAGAAATVRLFDNTSGAGTLLATVGLAALGSEYIECQLPIAAVNGIFAVITGTVEGHVRVP